MRLRALDCYYDAEDDSGYDGCDDEVPNRPAQERRRIDLVVIPVVWFVCHDLPPYPSNDNYRFRVDAFLLQSYERNGWIQNA